MEINASKTTSSDLLNCGNQRGFSEKLLLRPKPSSLQTERVPRSSVLERLQSFLPQMAEANAKLKKQMEETEPEKFNIENVEEEPRVIEMDVALVELNGSDGSDGSDSDSEEATDDSDSDSDTGEVTEHNIKLPGENKRKAQIQVLPETGE